MPIWLYPILVAGAGLLIAAAVLNRRALPAALILSGLLVLTGVSGWVGMKKAHCPTENGNSLAEIQEQGSTCSGFSEGSCCVELLPASISTCVLSETSGGGAVWQMSENYLLYAPEGTTAVASCIDWRPWKIW